MLEHMRRWPHVLLIAGLTAVASGAETNVPDGLFPAAEPTKSGYLKVSDLHEIWYAVFGNPQGKPVFVMHGGPGYGSYPRLMQYFNPEKFLIVLHDQRGAGQSRPAGELRENTMQDLVADVERLREHLGIEGRVLVFGGSWGSTLALAYAEAHPEHVSGMMLRGVWTGTAAEIETGFGGECMRKFFPDAMDRVEKVMRSHCGEFSPSALLEVFTSGDQAAMKEVADAWIAFAIKTGKMHATDEEVARGLGDLDPRSGARIVCHYAANNIFLEEGKLLREAHKLKDIPVTIINGRYDMTCPPVTAYRLHKLLPKSKLIIVEEAGHSEAEPGTTHALLKAVAEFE